MTDKNYTNYIVDLGMLLKEKARKAKLDKDNALQTENYDYKLGYLMALHEVISIMKQQADIFNIKQNEVALNDIDPEKDLL